MPDSKDTLTALVTEHNQLRQDMKAEDDRHAAAKRDLNERHAAIVERINLFSADLDLAKIDLARQVLELHGTHAKGGQGRDGVVRDAMDWFATGKSQAYSGLDTVYFGTKSYAEWYGQREDHAYNYGPRHGSTIFSIGLKRKFRAPYDAVLTEDQREACLYYLLNIERIEEAQQKATAA